MKKDSELKDFKPDYSLTFHSKDGKEVGHLNWNDGVMKFSGNMDESCKLFMEFLKPYMDNYLKGNK